MVVSSFILKPSCQRAPHSIAEIASGVTALAMTLTFLLRPISCKHGNMQMFQLWAPAVDMRERHERLCCVFHVRKLKSCHCARPVGAWQSLNSMSP